MKNLEINWYRCEVVDKAIEFCLRRLEVESIRVSCLQEEDLYDDMWSVELGDELQGKTRILTGIKLRVGDMKREDVLSLADNEYMILYSCLCEYRSYLIKTLSLEREVYTERELEEIRKEIRLLNVLIVLEF